MSVKHLPELVEYAFACGGGRDKALRFVHILQLLALLIGEVLRYVDVYVDQLVAPTVTVHGWKSLVA